VPGHRAGGGAAAGTAARRFVSEACYPISIFRARLCRRPVAALDSMLRLTPRTWPRSLRMPVLSPNRIGRQRRTVAKKKRALGHTFIYTKARHPSVMKEIEIALRSVKERVTE